VITNSFLPISYALGGPDTPRPYNSSPSSMPRLWDPLLWTHPRSPTPRPREKLPENSPPLTAGSCRPRQEDNAPDPPAAAMQIVCIIYLTLAWVSKIRLKGFGRIGCSGDVGEEKSWRLEVKGQLIIWAPRRCTGRHAAREGIVEEVWTAETRRGLDWGAEVGFKARRWIPRAAISAAPRLPLGMARGAFRWGSARGQAEARLYSARLGSARAAYDCLAHLSLHAWPGFSV
jgi:hypothetical protein